MGKLFFHPDIDYDLIEILDNTRDFVIEEDLLELYGKALNFISKRPWFGKILEHNLAGLSSVKFHDNYRQIKGDKPQYRIVYAYDETSNKVYILAVGLRNAKSPDSVYRKAFDRIRVRNNLRLISELFEVED